MRMLQAVLIAALPDGVRVVVVVGPGRAVLRRQLPEGRVFRRLRNLRVP